jgi:DNA-binding MarR family transcriptional regulator
MVSYAKQETLANFFGIKKVDQIRDYLYRFEKLGLIEIDKFDVQGQYGKFNRCTYKLDNEHFVEIGSQLYSEDISKELKGFLILLKCKCYNGSNTCGYSQAALADELNLSPSTVSKRINEGIAKGYIKKDKKGIHLLRDDIFKITNETEIGFWKCVYPSIITDEDIANWSNYAIRQF